MNSSLAKSENYGLQDNNFMFFFTHGKREISEEKIFHLLNFNKNPEL
jgi:hypothetical protein